MSFRIWAVGLRGFSRKSNKARENFHYIKRDCLDQSDFEPPKLLSMIPDSPDLGGIAKKVVGTPESHIGGAEVKGMFKIAELIFAHQVVTGINLLALNGSGGSVSVYCHQNKWYWADANSFVDVHISRGGNPGKEFLRRIGPGLEKTELNNFGVLAQISIVLSKYDSALPRSALPHLRIELRH